ncbi:MAG: SDR family oxidoreductase [Saprospiraceae bacterium]|nr:SDR family oxidoreductase [Saprospiraceae bacterium]
MKIFLTGATGYIGKRLLRILAQQHEVVCAVRDIRRMQVPPSIAHRVSLIEMDFLDDGCLDLMPASIDGAFYLIHSMSSSRKYFELEERCAINFRRCMSQSSCQHVVYLGGISNEEQLSPHLLSRQNVERELSKGSYAFTALRAGIIIGSGSASFEIIRDLVEKLPIMVTPRWLNTRCQPIGIADVLTVLVKSLLNPATYNQSFDIGGPDVLTYREMLLEYASVRGLRRWIFTLPVMTPRLSSYWLYFVTSTSYDLAVALVNSMKIEVVCKDRRINQVLELQQMSYRETLERTFEKIANNEIVSSWKDAYSSSDFSLDLSEFVAVPTFGCFVDRREVTYANREDTLHRIWSIGGESGWYYANALWEFRGFLDKLVGGVGLRRGRTSRYDVQAGDALDFWRVLHADRKDGRLLLFAEMKLPGDAWLEFRLEGSRLIQTATFRPLGLIGRLYWYSVLPFHGLIFSGMLRRLAA